MCKVVPYLADDLIDDPIRAIILLDQSLPFTLEQLMLPSIYDDDESLLLLLYSLICSFGDLVEFIEFTQYVPIDPHMVDDVPL